MQRDVVWELENGVSTEHLIVVGVREEKPFRIRYRVDCDGTGTVRRVEIDPLGTGSRLELEHDGGGNWTENGADAPELAECRDVDISITPFTNTVPIRRLDLDTGESETIPVVYLDVPAMTATQVEQRYTCLESLSSSGGVFRYESLESGFTADLYVDSDGVVVNYPGVFRWMFP